MRRILYILALIMFVLCMDKINAYTEYKIGDVVPYNGMNFYVIKDSSSEEDSVTMLKAEPLTVEEITTYLAGIGAFNNGTGGMQYHASSNNYETSYVKIVVEAWAAAKVSEALDARLITLDELINEFHYESFPAPWGGEDIYYPKNDNVPNWLHFNSYWTMTSYLNSDDRVLIIHDNNGGYIGPGNVGNPNNSVRPVITFSKTALGDIDESIVDDNIEKEDSRLDTKDNIVDNKSNENKTTVKVANTYMSNSIIIIILGFIIASESVLVIYKLSNKKR